MAGTPLVGILMGSESDSEVMEAAAKELAARGIPYESNVLSAHRDPEGVRAYARGAEGRGLKVIIAGAGKAAALPGVVASMTGLPVIGVPIKTSDLGGLDSLLSIVQMPPGVPVATMAINGARNAAILAAQILRVAGLVGSAQGETAPGASKGTGSSEGATGSEAAATVTGAAAATEAAAATGAAEEGAS
jgi:5-(carboxyamino)imidazole ribonucleotide mutase